MTSGDKPGLTTTEREEIKALRKELLKRANEILKTASAFFVGRGARPPTQVITAFIDTYKADLPRPHRTTTCRFAPNLRS